MRIVKMDPNETRGRGMRAQPGTCMLNDIFSAPLQAAPSRFGLGRVREIIVKIKSSVQSRREFFAVENDRTDKCCRFVALLLEQLSQSLILACQRYGEVCHPVRAR